MSQIGSLTVIPIGQEMRYSVMEMVRDTGTGR